MLANATMGGAHKPPGLELQEYEANVRENVRNMKGRKRIEKKCKS